MNSDLVYKKKYLKYKNKYIALQKEMSIQEGGLGWSAFINPGSIKQGIYLFLISNQQQYYQLLDGMQLPQEQYLRDSGINIPRILGQGCYYVERKQRLAPTYTIEVGNMKASNVDMQSPIKQCSDKVETGYTVPFTSMITNIQGVSSIANQVKQQLPQITHFFIVDYNTRTSNRISALFPIEMQPMGQQFAQQGQQMQPMGQQFAQQGQQMQPMGQQFSQQLGQPQGYGQQVPIQQLAQYGSPGQQLAQARGFGQKYEKK